MLEMITPETGAEKPKEYKIHTFEEGERGENSLRVMEARPEEIVSETPVIIAPGWSLTAEALRGSLETFGRRGRHALTFDHGRKKKLKSISEDENEYSVTLQRAYEVIAALDQQEIEGPVNAVGYSEGGIDLLVAARFNPENFKHIVLVAPGGMVGKDGFFKLAGRFTKGSAKESFQGIIDPETRNRTITCLTEIAKSFGKNPAMAIREVWAIAHSDITEIVKELTELGIRISFVCGAGDMTFLMYRGKNKDGTLKENSVQGQAGRIYKELKEKGQETSLDVISVKGGHGELILHPEKNTEAIDALMRVHEKRN